MNNITIPARLLLVALIVAVAGFFQQSEAAGKDSLFNDETVAISGGWHLVPWLGFIQANHDPWLYHILHGWWYIAEESGNGYWIWDTALGWVWSSSEDYPGLWQASESDWLFFDEESGGPRYFYSTNRGKWIEIE